MKKNERIEKLLSEIDKALGDTGKSAEIFYLLKKQGSISTKQKEEIIKLEHQIVESQRKATEYANKFIQLLHILKQQGEISGRQQTDLVELGKKVIENHKATKEILLSLADIAKTLKIILPKSFDVVVKNINDFPEEFRISNLDEIPKPLDEISIKEPLWLPNFFESAFRFLTQPVIKVVQKQLQNVNIAGPTDPRKAIAVRLSDGKKFYTAVIQAIAAGAESLDTVESLLQQILSAQGATPTLANRYITTTNEVSTGTGEVDLFLVKNPSGSGKNTRVEQVLISSQDSGQRTFRLYRSAVISANGTALPVSGMKTSQSASVASAFKSPSITSRGSLIFGGNFGEGAPLQVLSVPFILLPGENLLITSQSTSDRIFLSLVWIEE